MNWKELGQTLVQKGAPVLGGYLLGPLGAVAGKALANKVGATDAGGEATPESVLSVVRDMSMEDVVQLDRDMAHELRMREIGHDEFMAGEWGKNYRAELSSKDPFNSRWRAFVGWCVGVETMLLVLMTVIMGVMGEAADVAEILSAALPIIGIQLGVVGYIAKKRSDDKHLSVGGAPPSLLGGLLGKVVK